ncbi:hypothetical protein DC31_05800 [Microbacterium sp. CH12i]|uniref:hypothetical protein n=1 Tax=Microbacterium sp. CH12i TaxID=1479651 RepID=UPI0004620294|nr:hypothetical protein [Microbacterium sp. CH12i]KDA04649.1 hypothetical protein DC31_05800 [Microbacterium sp. CH12i]
MTNTTTLTGLDLLATAAPGLLLIWLTALIALEICRHRINNTPVSNLADINQKAIRSRHHARAMIGWHALAAAVITAIFGLLSWPSALAAAPLLILPALGIHKWARTARTLTRMLKATNPNGHAQLTG